jgi:penicillin-binding protein 3
VGKQGALRFITCIVILVILAACTSQSPGAVIAETTPTHAPTPLSLNDAQRLAADFLNAWKLDNYNVMYSLLAVNSQDAFPRQDFESAYTEVEQTITLLPDGKSFALTNALQRGNSAEIAYEMTFNTRLFGNVVDSERILHLVSTPDGWRIAWSPGDVFVELKDGAVVELLESSPPNRGNIYDRDGNAIADQNGIVMVINLYTKTYPTGNPDDCFAGLARAFPRRSVEQFREQYGFFSDKDYVFEVGQISLETFQAEKEVIRSVCTVEYTNRPARRYVAGGLAPHITGYVGPIPAESVDEWESRGYPRDALVGIDGIERYWESTLAGRGKASLVIRSQGVVLRTLAERSAQPSQSVYLTIDRHLQESVQNALA